MARDEQPKGGKGGGNTSGGGGGGRRWPLVVTGLALGFLAGWWFPAPRALHFDEFRTSTNARLAEQGRRVRNKVADLTEALADKLRSSNGKVRTEARAAHGSTPLEVLQPAADDPSAAAPGR